MTTNTLEPEDVTQFTCAHCGKTFSYVNVYEKSDTVFEFSIPDKEWGRMEVLDGKIIDVVCPNCWHSLPKDHPVVMAVHANP